MSRVRPSRRGSRGVTPRLRAARARPCAAGNALTPSSPRSNRNDRFVGLALLGEPDLVMILGDLCKNILTRLMP